MQEMQFYNMASNLMSSAISVLVKRNFYKVFLRTWRAFEFSHSLGHLPTIAPQQNSPLINHLIRCGQWMRMEFRDPKTSSSADFPSTRPKEIQKTNSPAT